jgi:formylglycine-generating enzyme required for sulfatase activity
METRWENAYMGSELISTALQDIDAWLSLPTYKQDEAIAELAERLGGEYVHQYTLTYGDESSFRIPTFKHIPSGLEFNLVIGGVFDMGLSAEEEAAARALGDEIVSYVEALRPAQSISVQPFLMSRFPLLDSFARTHTEIDPTLFRPEFGEDGDAIPIYLTKGEVESLKEKFGFDIPSEAQWEYAYRGRTRTLFYFGNTLPPEDVLETEILLYHFDDPQANRKAANPFGLVGMCVGEWCEDSYAEDDGQVQRNELPIHRGQPYVVRGGAATLWPWQDGDEWILCVSAMRRSSDTLEDGTCGVRFVKSI